MSALVFMDTETTGLSLDDDIWEFGAVKRLSDGREREVHLFIEHAAWKCKSLPDSFYEDHKARFPSDGLALSPKEAAREIHGLFGADRPHVVGAVPNFDTERLALLLGRYGYEVPWHYHLIDVENLAVGYLLGRHSGGQDLIVAQLPWDSDLLSRACGVEPPVQGEGRHTAMGDVRWAMALYDKITGGSDA